VRRTTLDSMDEDTKVPEPEAPFKHLPPRITPEQMIEVQPIVHADTPVHAGAQVAWLIHATGGG
jgi:hypothetical protein